MTQLSLFLFVLLVEIVNSQDMRFATDCTTPNFDQGLCIAVQDCAKLYNNILQNKTETYEFLRASSCGPANEDTSRPKVCCGEHDRYVINQENSCTTPNGEKARCISLNSCDNLRDVVYNTNPDKSQAEFLRASVCGQEGRIPLVCCGSHTRYTEASLLPDRGQCGTQLPYKVLNGEDTELGEFPWMALVEQTKLRDGSKSFGCGGSLISARYVLTAAHCVVSSSYKVVLVRLGEWNLDTEEDCIHSNVCSPPPQDIAVEKITPHEEYSRVKEGVFNDIALIRLARLATLNDFVQPICMPLPNERSNVGDRLFVAGWGATESKRHSAKKQKLDVPIVDYNTCKAKFGGSGIRINTKMICAGGEKDKDSCKGDSGGPLIAEAKTASDQFYIEGIVSFGNICGMEGWPGIYTRVTDHLDWIHKNVKP